MNDTKFNRVIYLNRKYVVFLDFYNRFTFNSKREAQDFLTRISKTINEFILLITEDIITLEEFYRFYYLADKDYKFKHLVSGHIDFINNRLAWMSEHQGTTNHDTILFNALRSCFQEIIEAFELIKNKAAQRKDTLTKRRCELRLNILRIYEKMLMNLGIKSTELKVKKWNGKNKN